MSDAVTEMELIEGILSDYCPSLYQHLQPGLDEAYLNEMLPPDDYCYDELKKLYRWRNGCSYDYVPNELEKSFHICGNLIPLENALEIKSKLDELNAWEEELFPILYDGCTNYLLLDVKKSSRTYGMLYILSETWYAIPPQTIYDSLETFTKTIMHLYLLEAYKCTDEKLQVDALGQREISEALNPKSIFWKRGF